MTKQEEPQYEHGAIRPLAIMGMLGILGLTVIVLAFWFSPPMNWILWMIGIPLALIGIWLGITYVAVYHKVIRPDYIGLLGSTVTGFCDSLHGDEHILVVGCGSGHVAIGLAKLLTTGHVTGIDISEKVSQDTPTSPFENARIEGVKDQVKFQYGDPTEIPFEDATFDILTMDNVLHEIEEQDLKIQTLNEAYRVLKPGGRLVMLEWIRNRKMSTRLLFFAFVFKSLDYWNTLLAAFTDFQVDHPHLIKGPIDIVVYTMKKPD
ncbi:MAG: methyltransferase domain-containing protein [Candidatus Hermodarchaeota archaeon]|nr:methyltransferase domain-containing protein [Candidatus Hermodarchaeota archaeon]